MFFKKSLFLFSAFLFLFSAKIFPQPDVGFSGIKLRTEVQTVISEIEKKTGKKIQLNFGEFSEAHDESMLGSSFINDSGTPVVNIRFDLKRQEKKLEAVIAHELFHLRLRVNGFPVFLWSPTVKTRKGLAQEVEQSNVNDLLSLVEHRVFKAEMEKSGFNDALDLAGEAIFYARQMKGTEDGQAEYINYCRAVLEFRNPKDLAEFRKIYQENGWQRALKIGQDLADTIIQSEINTPAQMEAVFSRLLVKLYTAPRTFKFKQDGKIKAYRLLIISV